MASIRKEFVLDVSAAQVWDALRDFGALHRRLATGFVTDCRMDGDARIVTFANGTVARELLVNIDDALRRVAYAIAPNERLKHYNGAAQVVPEGPTQCRFVWTVDLLPNEIAPYVSSQMDAGVSAMKATLEKR
jgi:hypothetical protein